MAEKFNWGAYRPSKAVWFWSCVGCVAAALVIGFTWGGWVTGGTAEEMAAEARENGRAELAARLCVDRFLDAPDAAARLVELKDEGAWRRDRFIEDGGWATFADMEEPVEGAATLCASQLAEMEAPAAADAVAAEPAETAVN